ncbi:ATP-binding protein [Taibaiella koreensis]|uniref:ATP-binding protein n=1 Tax=Taibaiella koreensis TaxID=1268548 RepID=UPI000E59E75E|nr:ATP-binding protein [Taibaiella koreensis]
MLYQNDEFIKAKDLSFVGVLHDLKKSRTAMQPVFEAFTNALEAIKIKSKGAKGYKGEIKISLVAKERIDGGKEFESLSITDNGIGFNDQEFQRFNTFKLTTKGFKNLGSGRIQYVHFFQSATVDSYFESEKKFWHRNFVVSKREEFLRLNAIVKHRFCNEIETELNETTIKFEGLIDNSNVYNELNEMVLKQKLLERYLPYLCHNSNKLPKISIEFYEQTELKGTATISKSDIPPIDKKDKISINYYHKTAKGIEKKDEKENFFIEAFKIEQSLLNENKLNLVSKNEVIEDSAILLESLSQHDQIKGYKYLFLVSSDFIDARDTNLRGELNILNRDSFYKDAFSNDSEIFIEDIQSEVNSKINEMYPEIENVKRKHAEDFEKLKEMFLLDDETAESITISINDSETDILKKFYEAEAKKEAAIDATLKKSMDNLNNLDTRSPNYDEELKKEINILVNAIPLQNKLALTHYVARRKLILDLFDKILMRELNVQQQKENYDEALIHNLLFQKGSTDASDSDLWMINEDFIYFKGSSEKRLSKLEIDGKPVFKKSFSDEEERYLSSLGEDRKIKRPDVLLFPEEGKCIIIEFKAPHVNASDHLTQIDKYANFIRNYTEDEFQITTFYGYLLGENIEPRDVLGAVSRYEQSYQFDYLFRPSENVIGFDGRTNGSIYSEVIKYSTLLQRARQRNKIFINKLNQIRK